MTVFSEYVQLKEIAETADIGDYCEINAKLLRNEVRNDTEA